MDITGIIMGTLLGTVYVFVIILAVAFSLLPTIIAFIRKHERRWLILALNVILGGTGLGWIAALIWACMSPGHEVEVINQVKSLSNIGDK